MQSQRQSQACHPIKPPEEVVADFWAILWPADDTGSSFGYWLYFFAPYLLLIAAPYARKLATPRHAQDRDIDVDAQQDDARQANAPPPPRVNGPPQPARFTTSWFVSKLPQWMKFWALLASIKVLQAQYLLLNEFIVVPLWHIFRRDGHALLQVMAASPWLSGTMGKAAYSFVLNALAGGFCVCVAALGVGLQLSFMWEVLLSVDDAILGF